MPGQLLANAFNNRGTVYEEQRAYERAIADYDQAVQLNPYYAEAYNNRAVAYADEGKYDHAIADAGQAIRLQPNFTIAYNTRGNARYDKGDYDLAIADFDQAVRLNPNYIYAYNGRGNAYLGKGASGQAIADFDQALRLAPYFPAGHNNRGNAFYFEGSYQRAIAEYDEAIREVSNYAEAYNGRGNAHGAEGAYDTAIADYDRAIALNPNLAKPYANRGILRWKHDFDSERAIEDLEHALRLNPNLDYASYKLNEIRNARSAVGHRQSSAVVPGKRVALVIGNSDYTHLSHVKNAVADAREVAAALQGLGFEVQAGYDLSGTQLKQIVEEFGARNARNAETALVWYSGHGQSFHVDYARPDQGAAQNDDFIVPIDFALGDNILAKGVTVGNLINDVLPASKLEIVVVDACRSSGIPQRQVGLSGNSQPLAPAPGITPKIGNLVVVYSAQPQRTASDGPAGGHSPFAQAFLHEVANGDVKNDVRGFFGAVAHETLRNSIALGSDQKPDIVDDIVSGSFLSM